jgi:hypothetical protein
MNIFVSVIGGNLTISLDKPLTGQGFPKDYDLSPIPQSSSHIFPDPQQLVGFSKLAHPIATCRTL